MRILADFWKATTRHHVNWRQQLSDLAAKRITTARRNLWDFNDPRNKKQNRRNLRAPPWSATANQPFGPQGNAFMMQQCQQLFTQEDMKGALGTADGYDLFVLDVLVPYLKPRFLQSALELNEVQY